MNGYEKAQSLGLTGTDAEQTAILQTLTNSNIPTQDVRVWFRENRLWMEKPGGQMWGTLEAASASATPDQRQHLDYLFDVVFGGSSELIRASEPTSAGETWAVVQTIVALVPDSSGAVDSFYALGGGRPYKDLTEAEFASQRSDSQRIAAADQLHAKLQNEFIEPAASDPARTESTIRQAYEAAAASTTAGAATP